MVSPARPLHPVSPPPSDRWRAHRVIAWSCLATGIGSGLILGLWSFGGPLPVPALLGDYDAIPRRLVRLGHIALVALSMIHLLLLAELDRARLSSRENRWSARCMAFGNIALPLTLFLAAFIPPAKYAMALPATAVFLATVGGMRAALLTRSSSDEEAGE